LIIRLFVVEEHPVVRAGLQQILNRETFKITGEATTVAEALSRLRASDADMLLLGTALPLPSLREVLAHAAREHRASTVVVFGTYSAELYAAEAIRAGAAAYVSKRETPERLVEAMHAVARGEHLPGRWQDGAVAAAGETASSPGERLTERELQVLVLLSEGRTPKETAHRLRISPKTVSAHRANILRKLKLRNTVDLIRYALRQGLVQ